MLKGRQKTPKWMEEKKISNILKMKKTAKHNTHLEKQRQNKPQNTLYYTLRQVLTPFQRSQMGPDESRLELKMPKQAIKIKLDN